MNVQERLTLIDSLWRELMKNTETLDAVNRAYKNSKTSSCEYIATTEKRESLKRRIIVLKEELALLSRDIGDLTHYY